MNKKEKISDKLKSRFLREEVPAKNWFEVYKEKVEEKILSFGCYWTEKCPPAQ